MNLGRHTRLQNRLNRIRKMQEEYKPLKDLGLSNAEIYRRHIKEKYDISLDTYSSWLGVNVTKEQKLLDKEQLTIKKTK